MSTIITRKSNNPFYVEDNVPSSALPPNYSADISAQAAGNIIVYVAPAAAAVQTPIDLTITGAVRNAALKLVSLGVNRTFSSLTNSITLTNLSVGTVYGGLIVSANPKTGVIASKPIPGMTAALTGDTSLAINGGSYGYVYGGGGGYGSTVTGNTTVNDMGGRATAIYGGGDTGSTVAGNTNVTINGNVRLVYGGGGINSTVTGNTNIDYTGGRVSTIYGGGYSGSTVTGNTNIAIGDSVALSSISAIYGGGANSTVLGSTTITFSADAALLKFRGVVSGGGAGKKSIVGGGRNLVFDNYSGMFNGAIMNFYNITIGGASTMTLSRNQDRSDAGSTYNFVITDATLNNNSAMLTWNAKSILTSNNPIVVSITSAQMLTNGGDVSLISSSNYRTANSFNPNDVQVLDQFGNTVSSFLYTIEYTFDKNLGGNVSIDYKGSTFSISGIQANEIILTDNPENVTVLTGAVLMAGINTKGGNDVLIVQAGATIDGITDMGTGNDTLIVNPGGIVGDVQSEGTKLTVTGPVGGSVTMTAAAGNNELDIVGSLISADVYMNALTGNSSTLNVDAASSINGGIMLSGGASGYLNINGAVGGNVSTDDGNDVLNIAAPVGGVIDTGTGIDALNVNAGGTVGNVQAEGTLTVTGTVGGSVTMVTLTGDNELDLLGATIGNGVVMDAVAGNSTVNVYDGASTINGGITTGNGNDTLNIAGTVNGLIDTGAGSDVLNITGAVGDVQAEGTLTVTGAVGGSVNMVNIAAGSNIELDLLGAFVTGNVLMTNDGGFNTVSLGTSTVSGTVTMNAIGAAGDNSLTVAGSDALNLSSITGTVSMDAYNTGVNSLGNNTLNLSFAAIGSPVTMTAAVNNYLNISSSSTILGDLTMTTVFGDNNGNTLATTINGNVIMSAGVNNFVQLDSSTINGTVSMDAGAGSGLTLIGSTISNGVTITATVNYSNGVSVDAASSINGGITFIGDDIAALNVDGVVAGNVTATGAGNDILFVNAGGSINGSIQTGAGNDTLSVSGTVTGLIDMGTGYDVLYSTGTVGDVQSEAILAVEGTVGGNVSNSGGVVNLISATIGGNVSMTAGDNLLTLDPSTVNGSVTMTAAAGNNELDLAGSTIGTGVTMTASAPFTSTVNVDAASKITAGGITLIGAADGILNINGAVGGNVTTDAGNDILTVTATGTISGAVDTGAGNNTVNVSGTGAYVFSGITSTGGTALSITGTAASGEDITVKNGGFGSVGATTTVDSTVESLDFNTVNSTAAGILNTAADGANVFDASSLTNGQTLIDGTNLAGWDILDSAAVGGHGVALDGNAALGVGESVNLVNNHAVNLDNWNASGITSVALTVGLNTGSLTWNAANHDYEGSVGGHTWTLGDAGQTKLTLGITA